MSWRRRWCLLEENKKFAKSKKKNGEESSWKDEIRKIIRKRPGHPDDHLQKAGPSLWSFAKGQPIQMIICKRKQQQQQHDIWSILFCPLQLVDLSKPIWSVFEKAENIIHIVICIGKHKWYTVWSWLGFWQKKLLVAKLAAQQLGKLASYVPTLTSLPPPSSTLLLLPSTPLSRYS